MTRHHEPVALDGLLTGDQRRTDDDEDFGGDPLLLDRLPARRSKVDADRLLRLLDELAERGDG